MWESDIKKSIDNRNKLTKSSVIRIVIQTIQPCSLCLMQRDKPDMSSRLRNSWNWSGTLEKEPALGFNSRHTRAERSLTFLMCTIETLISTLQAAVKIKWDNMNHGTWPSPHWVSVVFLSCHPLGKCRIQDKNMPIRRESLGMCMDGRKTMRWHSKKVAICSPKGEASGEAKAADTGSWLYSFQNCEKMNAYCLNPLSPWNFIIVAWEN